MSQQNNESAGQQQQSGQQNGQQQQSGQQNGQQQQSQPPEFTPPASQEELDRIITSRLARHKPADYDALKAQSEELSALKLEKGTDIEKAIATAQADAVRSMAPQLVRAEFKAAAKGVLSGDQVKELLEDLDLTKYVNGKGEVDDAKIERKISAFAPVKVDPPARPTTGFGQGRQPQTRISGKELGAAEAAKRFGKKTA